MICVGYIKSLTARIDTDGKVVQEMKLIVQGDMKGFQELMEKPLGMAFEPKQMEFGKGIRSVKVTKP